MFQMLKKLLVAYDAMKNKLCDRFQWLEEHPGKTVLQGLELCLINSVLCALIGSFLFLLAVFGGQPFSFAAWWKCYFLLLQLAVFPILVGLPLALFVPEKCNYPFWGGYIGILIRHSFRSVDAAIVLQVIVVLFINLYYTSRENTELRDANRVLKNNSEALNKLAKELYGDKCDPITGKPIETAEDYFVAIRKIRNAQK